MTYANLIPVPNYGIDDLAHLEVLTAEPPPACDFITQPAELAYQAVKIARAKTGTSEIRLLQKLSDGKPSGFAIQNAVTAPYTRDQKDLVMENGEPMTESDAIEAFDLAVAQKYPASKLRNGTSVPTHLFLL